MTKYEKLDELLEIGNGYLFTSDVEKNGISRTYLAKYVKEKGMEKVAKGMYIAENAWRYGFIVRYIKAKEAITGYREETWHIRYVGDQAKAIYDSGLTLEEYLGIEGGDYLNP